MLEIWTSEFILSERNYMTMDNEMNMEDCEKNFHPVFHGENLVKYD